MENLKINDLYNPNGITSFLHTNGNIYEAGENQGFQEYPGSIELWEKLKDGRLMRVKRWLKKSVITYY